MSVEFKVDDREFQATLKKYLAVSSRSLSEALNQKMFYIVRKAVTLLPKVEKSKIEQDLGVSGYELKYSKERTPSEKKVNLKKEARKLVRRASNQLRKDAKAFKKDVRKSSKQIGKRASRAASHANRRASRITRKAIRSLKRAFR